MEDNTLKILFDLKLNKKYKQLSCLITQFGNRLDL